MRKLVSFIICSLLITSCSYSLSTDCESERVKNSIQDYLELQPIDEVSNSHIVKMMTDKNNMCSVQVEYSYKYGASESLLVTYMYAIINNQVQMYKLGNGQLSKYKHWLKNAPSLITRENVGYEKNQNDVLSLVLERVGENQKQLYYNNIPIPGTINQEDDVLDISEQYQTPNNSYSFLVSSNKVRDHSYFITIDKNKHVSKTKTFAHAYQFYQLKSGGNILFNNNGKIYSYDGSDINELSAGDTQYQAYNRAFEQLGDSLLYAEIKRSGCLNDVASFYPSDDCQKKAVIYCNTYHKIIKHDSVKYNKILAKLCKYR